MVKKFLALLFVLQTTQFANAFETVEALLRRKSVINLAVKNPKETSLVDELRNKKSLVIVYWGASWCSFCQEFVDNYAVYDPLLRKHMIVFAVSTDKSLDEAKKMYMSVQSKVSAVFYDTTYEKEKFSLKIPLIALFVDGDIDTVWKGFDADIEGSIRRRIIWILEQKNKLTREDLKIAD